MADYRPAGKKTQNGRGSVIQRAVSLCAVALMCLWAADVHAQAPAASKDKDKEPIKPKNVELRTRDGVQLAATYYASNAGKEAVPIILLHQYKGSRADYQDLAMALQAANFAVLVPDLRGHGQSKRQLLPNGRDKEIDVALLNKQDLERMVVNDVETCKSFLLQQHNAGELNIDKLGIVGAEMGAVVAANWAALDWSWPVLATGKQGQDVKAVVLISPPWSFKGLTLQESINKRELTKRLSWLVVVGAQQAGEARDAKRIHQVLEKVHPIPPAAEAAEKQALYFLPKDTTLQGTKLLDSKDLNVAAGIVEFFKRRLVNQTYPWVDRKSPL
jgi:pimeloyl-ACP methyl ester carboxylesterase